MEMETIKTFYLEDDKCETVTMPLPNVESWELEKVIDYCSKYLELKNKEDFDRKLKVFQAEFIKSLSPKCLLCLQYLQDFICQAVADHIKNKDVEYGRSLVVRLRGMRRSLSYCRPSASSGYGSDMS
ncbi:hypothetical protein ACLB2K_028609 [Fragaria x ananassa]